MINQGVNRDASQSQKFWELGIENRDHLIRQRDVQRHAVLRASYRLRYCDAGLARLPLVLASLDYK